MGLRRVPVVRLCLNYSTGSASQMVIFCLGLQLKRVERGLERCKFYFSFYTNTGIGKESLYSPDNKTLEKPIKVRVRVRSLDMVEDYVLKGKM